MSIRPSTDADFTEIMRWLKAWGEHARFQIPDLFLDAWSDSSWLNR